MNSPARKGAVLTIPNGSGTSNSVDIGEGEIVAVVTDSAFDAADLSVEASIDGGTSFVPVKDTAGNAIKITAAAASNEYGFNSDQQASLRGVRRVRVKASVNQTGPSVITLLVR